ncbi:hypothetical protein VaNZ11_012792 [Volvox africanus]|uniref:Alpha-2-macroglobulin domain-containing protein n=1 Tax=Volvox africanus TaxID=51714 RepID=A0ABQ5SFV2_9CHLO|nr:hypothetical protein VaNZ11_012792 [Volvox africanus]
MIMFPSHGIPSLAVVSILLVFGGLHITAAQRPNQQEQSAGLAFLENQLPLKILLSTPTDIIKAGPQANVSVDGRQAITAVFSRPVIALGSDFGLDPANHSMLPFSLSCPVPGRFRWVTTSIARFDPDVDWPTDLDCTLNWVTTLTAYDGASLELGDIPPSRRLVSKSLTMRLTGMVSELAYNLTDGLWDGTLGLPSDVLPEVPPDGRLVLDFNYPVNLALLRRGLKFTGNRSSKCVVVAVDVAPCQRSPILPRWKPSSSSSSSPVVGHWASNDPDDVNATCVEVRPMGRLEANTRYTLQLTRGSHYNSMAGPLGATLSVTCGGLRPFHVPWSPRTRESRLIYRRIDLWLPHGLSSETTTEALAARITLCRENNENGVDRSGASDIGNCTAGAELLPYNLSMVSRGRARLSVPSLKPGSSYRAVVRTDGNVKDGFGQGLQASSTDFTMSYVPYAFAPPLTSGSLVLLEGGAETLTAWPYIVHPPPPPGDVSCDECNIVYESVAAWAPDFRTDRDVAKLLSLLRSEYSGNLWMLFGDPVVEVPLPVAPISIGTRSGGGGGDDWKEILLPLLPSAHVHVVHACCEPPWYGNGVNRTSGHVQVLLNTTLSVSAFKSGTTLVLWVLDAALGGGPVAGAVATVFADTGEFKELPTSQGRCTTDTDGLCNITLDIRKPLSGGSQLSLVVAAGDQFAILPHAAWLAPGVFDKFLGKEFIASLVSDRLVVVPGDSLKITGFVQRVNLSNLSLELPPESVAVLQVDPAWIPSRTGSEIGFEDNTNDANRDAGSVTFVTVNGSTGTLHGDVVVPRDVRLQSYTIRLRIQPSQLNSTDVPVSQSEYGKWPVSAELAITVAEPRPPTADLQLSAPAWSFPNSSVSFTATAASFIGVSVSGANLTATWRTAKASGLLQLSTDTEGRAEGTIDLGALPPGNRSDPYDNLKIDVEWIGPTRERITRSASVTLADGPARLQLQLSLTPSTPGTSFAVAAALTSNTDGAALTGIPVTATLRPAPNATSLCGNATSSCALSSGASFSPSCQLALPCVGQFLLEACADVTARAAATTRVCTNQTLGYSSSYWAENPWSSHDSPTLASDKQSFALGESPVLLFQNPWPKAKVLVVWGNEANIKTKVVTSLPGGALAQIPLGPLGEECIRGCSVGVALDVPRLHVSDLPSFLGDVLRSLPTSRLFDPLAPHSHTLSLKLDVRPDNTFDVVIGVQTSAESPGSEVPAARDAGGQTLPTLEPGATATIKVALATGMGPNSSSIGEGVEVTVYGVDKAFLDLLPYDLPHLDQEMILRLADDINVATTNGYRIAPDAVRAVYDKLMARLTQLDPWLPANTFVGPGGPADVDLNDTTYLSRFSSTATLMPWAYGGYPAEGSFSKYFFPHTQGRGRAAYAYGGLRGVPFLVEQAMVSTFDMGFEANGVQRRAWQPPQSNPVVFTQPRATSAFVVTPLFGTAVTGPDGTASLEFTAPPNLGTFVIRAFAAAGSSGRYGSGEAKIAVRRRLSLTPSLPRFARVGDVFQSGVIVTVGSAPATVNVQLQIGGDALSATGPLRQTVTFAAEEGLQREVRFAFSAVAMNSANLTFAAQDMQQPGGGEDSLITELQVLGQQGDVWVATSFALSALPPSSNASSSSSGGGGGMQWQEGMELPAAVPGSGSLNLTVGVGYFPAVASMYETLQQTDVNRMYPEAPPALLWATLPSVLSYYRRTATVQQAAAIAGGFQDLALLTDSRLGLMWAPPSRWGNWWPSRTDLYLNTWALFLFAQHGPALGCSPFAASWASLESQQVPMWRAAVNTQIVLDAEAARKLPNPRPYNNYNTLAWAWLALGARWDPRTMSRARDNRYANSLFYFIHMTMDNDNDSIAPQVVTDLSLMTLVGAATPREDGSSITSLQTRVLTSLVLQTMGADNPAVGLVAATVDQVTSGLRVQGRTAYVSDGSGAASAAPLEDQALALLLLLRAGVNHQLLPKLAAYIANPPATGGYDIWYTAYSWREQGLAVAALSEYDRMRGSSTPDVEITAATDGVRILKASFTQNSTGPVTTTTTTPWSQLQRGSNRTSSSSATAASSSSDVSSSAPSQLSFEVTGSGEVTVAASLHFVPAELVPYPSYRGLFVESALQMVDPATGGPTGQRVSAVPLGSLVALAVQVTSPDDVGPVTLSVMMPAGLEPIDPNLGSGSSGGSCAAQQLQDVPWTTFWLLPICPAQETRPSLVTFSYMALRAGTSSVSLRAVAATPGSFIFPPVRAAADNQPELMGMTAAFKLQVCTECKVPTYIQSSLAPPKPCGRKGCGRHGICNLSTGKCVCDHGNGNGNGNGSGTVSECGV